MYGKLGKWLSRGVMGCRGGGSIPSLVLDTCQCVCTLDKVSGLYYSIRDLQERSKQIIGKLLVYSKYSLDTPVAAGVTLEEYYLHVVKSGNCRLCMAG